MIKKRPSFQSIVIAIFCLSTCSIGCIPMIKDMQTQIDHQSQAYDALLKKLAESNKNLADLTKEHNRIADMLKDLPTIMSAQKAAFDQLEARIKALEANHSHAGKKKGFK